jgi:hypothetical protein
MSADKSKEPADVPLSDYDISAQLLRNIKNRLPELEKLFDDNNERWTYEDPIYRFYHRSFKVYNIQLKTEQIVGALESLLPDCKLDRWFLLIVSEGTVARIEIDHNEAWTEKTRPEEPSLFLSVCPY